MFFAILIPVLLVVLYWYSTRNFDYWKKKGVKHEPPLPFVGNNLRGLLMQKSMTQLSDEVYWKFPNEKVAGFYRFSKPELILRDPELVKRVLITDFHCFYGRNFAKVPEGADQEPLLNTLFNVDGDLWRLLRQRMTPAFTSGKLKAMFPLIVKCAEHLQERLASCDGQSIDARDLMARFTNDFIGACGFGVDENSLTSEDSEFRKLGKKLTSISPKEALKMIAKLNFPSLFPNIRFTGRFEKDVMSLYYSVLEARNNAPSGRNDFLDQMLECRNKGLMVGESLEHMKPDGTPEVASAELTDGLIAAQMFVFFAAGFETSSSATSFTLHQLAYHPEVQKKLHEHIDSVMEKHNNKLSYDCVKDMYYLEWALKESLRMFPSVGFLVRSAMKKYTFEDIGLTIDSGVKVVIPNQAMQNDPQYFDNPEEFRPERFDPSVLDANKTKFVYMPFGEGPRNCIGGEDQLDPGVRFTAEPQDAVAAPGAPVILPCAALTRHASRLGWRHNVGAMPTREHALSPDDKYRKQLPNGSLVIDSMSASLAGQYQCVVSVDGVGTIVSRIATVFLAEVPELVPGPRSVLGVAGGVALLTCGMRASPRVALRVAPAPAPDRRVYGAARVHQSPPTLKLNVTWLKNGSPVRMESARVSVTPSGALEMEPLKHHDAAQYRCRVALLHSPHIFKDGEEIELRVSTEVGNVESPPRFIATPQPVTIMEGASVTFDCAATGNPKPEITWLNNGVAIDLSDLDSRFYLAGSGSLRVQSARALDAGAYTCRAHSRLDSADHTTVLHVQTAPRVQVEGSSGGAGVVARARGDAVLRCTVRGRPAPAPLWLKDGDPLSPNNHDIAIVDGSSLRIQGVLMVDAGMFQCMATSPAGSATATVRLAVLPADDDLSNITDTQDILTSLPAGGSALEPSPEDPDFLGETSSAYTSNPEDYDYSDSNSDSSFHAAEGLEDLGGNGTVSAPRGLRAVIVKHRFVTLSWEAPEGGAEGGAGVTGYAVIYKVKGSERERVSRGSAQRHEMNIPSLQPNTTYQFQVMAYSPHGTSPRTDVIEVQTAEEELSHGPPQNVHAEALGPHVIRVSWSPPAPNPSVGPAPVPTKYTVHYTEVESGREQFQQVEVDPSMEVISHTISGLRAATQYSVGVSARGGGAGGAGGAAAARSVRTASAAPAAPPGNVTAAAAGPTSLIVRWEAPPSRTHGGPLTGYKVRYRPLGPSGPAAAPNRRKADSLTTPANTRRAELTDLDTATTYQIRVSAINANGTGPFSEWISATTHTHQRDEASVPPQPPPLTTRSGRDWISVWWSEDGAGGNSGVVVRGYLLGWGLGVPDEMSRNLPAHIHSHVIRGLESNAEYVISLRASNSRGLGPAVYGTVRTRPAAGEGDDADDLPDDLEGEGDADDGEDGEDDPSPLIPPVGVKAIMLSGTTAVVYWTDPTLPKGQPVADGRRYVVRWAVAAGAGGGGGAGAAPAPAAKVRYFNATDLNCMLDELKPFTQYEFSVKLIKGGRESAWSMLVWNRTLESPPAAPPRDLRVTPAPPPARAVELIWHPPAKPNGLITGYLVMYAIQRGGSSSLTGTEEWTTMTVSGERTRARVDRLRPRTTYHFKLQAKNSKGMGPICAPVTYTTAMESGEGGGLASATSAWLWASAGGACAVLALAAALALSLCCRRTHPPLSPDTSTYQKSSASAAIKPPDLWIHHDQMELKHMDKGLHSSASKISASSVEGGAGLMSSTLTLGRAPAAAPPPGEYEPPPHPPPPASLDRRHYVPTYVDYGRAASLAGSGSDDTAVMRASPSLSPSPLSPLLPPPQCARCDPEYGYKSMTGMGMGPGCAATCDRRHRMPHPDQSTPLLAGVGPLGSPQSSLASLAPLPQHHSHLPMHPPPPPCGSGTCPLGAACTAGGAGGVPPAGGDIYACAARERGHYVAYEPLGHYTHRDSVSSDANTNPNAGSLQRVRDRERERERERVGAGAGVGAAPMHSFALSDNASQHSTPTHSHSRGSVRETSPYKKSASSSPGHVPNRLQLGGCAVSHCPEELEPLTPSRSTERLHREMQNLEGLMKDLSAITQHQFHC